MASFRDKIDNNEVQFVITCEISPPRGPNTEVFEQNIRLVSGRVDAVNITDNPMLSVRMSPAVASLFAIKNGVEPIMQITCRDRNILGITSELISAWAIGVRNVLVLWGDMPQREPPRGVFEVDVERFLKLISDMRNGYDFRGHELNGKCDFFPGAALNPFAPDLRENAQRKIEAGAKFFQTQPIFDIKNMDNFLKFIQDVRIPVLTGVIIITSEKMLENIKKFAKGMSIPKKLEEDISRYEDKEKVGIEFAAQLIEDIKNIKVLKGAHIYSPAKEKLIAKLLDLIGR